MAIPLVDLKAQYQTIKGELDPAIQRVIDNTSFIMGEEVSSFEEDFAAFCRARYAVGTSSGTSALHLALLACGVGPGDEVITSPHTFTATAEAIIHAGAVPVFVDIDLHSYNIAPERIEAAITRKTKAFLPVHLYGRPAEMDPIMELAGRHGLAVIEDAAQAHGAEYGARRVGSMGHASSFSFYPGKNLGAYGDGGAVVTNDQKIAERVRLLRNHGRRDKYEHLVVGYGYRLDALQAAILKAKLEHLHEWNERRRANADTYRGLLQGLDLVLPQDSDRLKSVYHLFVVRTAQRDALREHLRSKEIHSGVHYPIPLHLHPAYQHLGYREGDFPSAEQAAREVLSLPMYPELTRSQMEEVARAITQFLSAQPLEELIGDTSRACGLI
jgi:dTDP-4-amino-4,6-dideoxygalactose transaminase